MNNVVIIPLIVHVISITSFISRNVKPSFGDHEVSLHSVEPWSSGVFEKVYSRFKLKRNSIPSRFSTGHHAHSAGHLEALVAVVLDCPVRVAVLGFHLQSRS